eukprot:gene2331-2684_t
MEQTVGQYERYEATSMQEALAIIQSHELMYTLRNTMNWSPKDFRKSEKKETNHKVQWNNERRPFDGTPFFLNGYKKLDCQHGQDKQATAKDNRKSRRRERTGQDHVYQRNYTMFQKTKKFGCPAQIKILEITDFPDFKISQDTERRRRDAGKKLKAAIEKKRQAFSDKKVHSNNSSYFAASISYGWNKCRNFTTNRFQIS